MMRPYEITNSKSKRTTLFRLGDLYIAKDEQCKFDINTPQHTLYCTEFSKKITPPSNPGPDKPQVIKKNSPLGFWYHKTIPFTNFLPGNKYIKYTRLVICYGTTRWEAVIPTNANGMSVNKYNRPWDVSPDCDYMSDAKIKPCMEAIRKFATNVGCNTENYSGVFGKVVEQMGIEKYLYNLIFGSETGPTWLTDKDKIELHGFDYKTSFRKM